MLPTNKAQFLPIHQRRTLRQFQAAHYYNNNLKGHQPNKCNAAPTPLALTQFLYCSSSDTNSISCFPTVKNKVSISAIKTIIDIIPAIRLVRRSSDDSVCLSNFYFYNFPFLSFHLTRPACGRVELAYPFIYTKADNPWFVSFITISAILDTGTSKSLFSHFCIIPMLPLIVKVYRYSAVSGSTDRFSVHSLIHWF